MQRPRPPASGRVRYALVLCSMAALSLFAAVSSAAPPLELDAYARDWAERADISGSWRVERGTQVLAEGSRGFVHGSSGDPIDPNTVFWVGSISKQFASVAVLRLVEQGKLALDAPLTRYLPELEPEAAGKDGALCTLEHVLSHRCGFVRDAGGAFDFHDYLADTQQQAAFLERVNQSRTQFAPGSDFSYSNLGFDLVGLVVQRASGQPYAVFLQEQLWGPLGMTRTGIRLGPGLTLARGLTGAVFTWVDAADWLRFDSAAVGSLGPSGNVYSTPNDILRWTHALHHGEVLQPSSYAELIRPRLSKYALGLAVESDVFGPMIWHNGALSPQGYTSELVYLPTQDISVAVLTNRPRRASPTKAFAGALLRKATALPEKVPERPGVAALLAESLPFFALVLMPVWLGVSLLRLGLQRTKLDAQSWWLEYHSSALLLAMLWFSMANASTSPWLEIGAALIVAGAHQRRWWSLEAWARGRGVKAYLGLGARAVFFLAMLALVKPAVLWGFGAVVVGESVLLIAVAYRARLRGARRVARG